MPPHLDLTRILPETPWVGVVLTMLSLMHREAMPSLALHGISVLQEGVTSLRTTDRGRIFSYADPALGTTANTVFVAVAHATLLKPYGDPRARTYTCWALQQERPTLVAYLALALPEHG